MKSLFMLAMASSLSNCIKIEHKLKSNFVANTDEIDAAQQSTIYPYFYIDPDTEKLSSVK